MTKELVTADTFSLTKLTDKTSVTVVKLSISAQGSSEHSHATWRLIEPMLNSGTKKQDRDSFQAALSTLGATLSIDTKNRSLHFTLSCRDAVLEDALGLLAEAWQVPSLTASDLKRVKKIVKNELHEETEDARSIARQTFVNHFYGRKDNRFEPLPNELLKDIDNVKLTDIKSLHTLLQNGYVQATAFGSKESANACEQLLRSIKGSESSLSTTSVTNKNPKVALVSIPSKQNIEFAIGASLPFSIHDDAYPAFVFGLSVLGLWGGFTGRLMSTVREKEGLTYGIYARTEGFTATASGHWRIFTFFSPEKAVTGLKSTLNQIELLLKKGVTDHDMKKFKEILRTRQLLGTESALNQVSNIHGYKLLGIEFSDIEPFQRRLLDVSKREVNRVLRKHLHPQTLSIVGAGPINSVKKDITAFAKKLR